MKNNRTNYLKKQTKKLTSLIKKIGIINCIITLINYIFKKIETLIYYKYICLISYHKEDIIKNPLEVIKIKTKNIQYGSKYSIRNKKLFFSTVSHVGTIKKFDLKKDIEKLSKRTKYIALKERFIQNKKWKKTAYYKAFLNKKTTESKLFSTWNCFETDYLTRFDYIYLSIKNKYKLQREFKKNNINEIGVSIDKNGEIILTGGGEHRLAIAKILKIKRVPVVVNFWHKDYIDWIKENTNIKNITPKTAIKPILSRKFKKTN